MFKSIWNKMFKNTDKVSTIVFITLRILVIICMIVEILRGNFQSIFNFLLTYVTLGLPLLFEKLLKINIPVAFEIGIYLFIIMAEMLGGVYNFYFYIPSWDIILHTFWGFLCAALGFSLIYILNKGKKNIKASAIFLALVGFCFSMTIGVIWEFFEYGADNLLSIDSQRDEYVDKIVTVKIDDKKTKIKDIGYTIVYDKEGKKLIKFDKYLDIGLNDTISDMLVNFVGAFSFSVLGYLYAKDEKKYKFVELFVIKNK